MPTPRARPPARAERPISARPLRCGRSRSESPVADQACACRPRTRILVSRPNAIITTPVVWIAMVSTMSDRPKVQLARFTSSPSIGHPYRRQHLQTLRSEPSQGFDALRARAGGSKPAWWIFMIVLPLIAILIYLIAHHDGMARPKPQTEPIPAAPRNLHLNNATSGATFTRIVQPSPEQDNNSFCLVQLKTVMGNPRLLGPRNLGLDGPTGGRPDSQLAISATLASGRVPRAVPVELFGTHVTARPSHS